MPHQPSQDLEARFSVFLNPIRDLTKNWEVDIAKYLEDYLVELSEIQITFDGGVTVMNFAEAAMLIQGSATVYSKKVEFLWQMVLQMLDLLSSKRNLDLGDEESHKTGATGRSSKSSPILNFERVNKGSIGKNIDLKLEDEVDEKKSEFKFLPAVPLHLVEKESEKSTTHVTLYLKNKEPFGNKDDYRINRSYLAPSGLLCLDLPLEFLQQNLGQKVVSDGEANESVAGFFNNDSVLDEPVVPPEVNEEAVPDVDMAEDDVDHGGGIENNEEVENMEVDAPMDLDPGEDLPPENPVLNDEGNDPISESVEESLDKDPNEVETLNGRYGLRRKVSKEKIVDIIKLTDPLKPLDPHIETPARRPVRAGRLRKPLPCSCHKEMFKQKKSRTRSKALKEVDNLAAKTISVEEFITKDLARLIANNNNNNSDSKLGPNVNAKLLQELTNENKKKQEKVKKEKLKDLPHENEDFGDEKGSVEQAGMAAVEGGDIEDYDDNDAIPNLDFENIDDGNNFDLPEPHPNSDIETPFGIIRIGDDDESDGNSSRTLNDSMLYEPGSDYEALVQKWVSDYIANAQEHVVSSDLVRRVNRWRKIITPKLVEEEGRKDFDIHEYGTSILSHFPSDSDGGQVPFSQVAKHDDHREISRIFLSCLMLANTYNVHLSNTIEGPLQMDCLQLKLLSRVRHHQELDEAASSRQQQTRPRTISPQSNPSDKRASPVNRNRKKKRRKTVVSGSSGGDSGSGSETYSDDPYLPSKEPSSGSDNINSNRQSRSPSSRSSSSSKKRRTLSADNNR